MISLTRNIYHKLPILGLAGTLDPCLVNMRVPAMSTATHVLNTIEARSSIWRGVLPHLKNECPFHHRYNPHMKILYNDFHIVPWNSYKYVISGAIKTTNFVQWDIYVTSKHYFHTSRYNLNNDQASKKSESDRPGDKKGLQNEETSHGKKDVIFTIPNALTISRIILAPILGYMVLQHSYALACGMFVYAGITDLLDGYIARRYPTQASSFGSYLDPLADKFLISILFVSLTMVDLIPVALTGLIVLRDVLLVSAAFYVRYISLPPPITIRRYFDVTHATAQLHPTFISKLNTAVQLSLVATTLAAPIFGYIDHIALQSLWYITAGTTIASGITYIFAKDTFRIIRETKQKKQQANNAKQQE